MVHAITSDATEEVIARAKSALSATAIYALRELTVESDGVRIVLSGQVSTYYHKQLAQEAIRVVSSGYRLTNHIEVDDDL